LTEVGKCLDCGEFTRPDGVDESNRICVSENCTIGEILMPDGTCSECAPYSHPDSDAKKCITDTCDYTVEFLEVTGTCKDCEEYTYPVPVDEETK